MNKQSVFYWLKLALVPRLENQVVKNFLSHHSIDLLDELDDATFVEFGFKPQQVAAWRNVDESLIERCLRWSEQPNRHIIVPSSSLYPYLLKQITDHPKALFVEGNPKILNLPQIAIVGSRNASQKGLALSHKFAKELAELDTVITSGLALGIDGRAHRGALDGKGKTIAVLGSGLDVIYPKMHQALANEIKETGALVSELYPWSPPKAAFFPKRNRLISGLSTGVLVVEAALRSGSLITARLALEQGREVFALPSAFDDPYGKGSNGLIKQGAFLVESVQDIFNQVTTLANCVIKNQISESCDSALQEELPFSSLLANVGEEATSVDVLANTCKQPVYEIMTQLLELELQGLVAVVPGGYVRTRRS